MDYYKRGTNTVELDTGKRVVEYGVIKIRRAILLPTRLHRDFVYDLSFVAANKNFTYGGLFDTSERRLIVDVEDLPIVNDPAQSDHVFFEEFLGQGREKYVIKEVALFENNRAFMFLVKRVRGQKAKRIFDKSVIHYASMSGVAT